MSTKLNILVTGGAGYIGSHTVIALLEANFNPIIIDNFENSSPKILSSLETITHKKIISYKTDCRDIDALQNIFEKNKIHGVIHFAAYKAVGESVRLPLKYYKNNINSLINILDVMNNNNVHNLVFSSSCTVYGQPDKLPVTESSPLKNAESPYGSTKKIGEYLIDELVKYNHPIKAAALRYFNPIGAHESAKVGELPLGIPNNLVPFITQTAAGIRKSLTIFGKDYNTPDGTCIRDYIHVMDLAEAHVQALRYIEKQKEKSFWDIFNLGTGRGHSVLEVVKTFEKVTNQKLNYTFGPKRPGDVEQVFASVEKANQQLNWSTKRDLAQALKDAWNWQKKLIEYEF